jgi:hypothetical protein
MTRLQAAALANYAVALFNVILVIVIWVARLLGGSPAVDLLPALVVLVSCNVLIWIVVYLAARSQP